MPYEHKNYTFQPEKLATLSVGDVDFYLDVDPEFVFDYSAQAMGAVCAASPVLARKFVAVMTEMAAAINSRDDREYLRPGSGALFEDKYYLLELCKVARKYASSTPAETKAEIKTVAPTATAALSSYPDTRETETAIVKKTQANRPPDSDLSVRMYLPAAGIGQFLQPTMLVRSGLFRAGGSDNDARESWTTTRPLVINHFSGIAGGSTTVFYVGEELRSGDQEAWTLLLNYATATALGDDITITMLAALRSAPGRGTGTNSRGWLRLAGQRLQAATLTVRTTDVNVIALMKAYFPEDTTVQTADKTGVTVSFPLLGGFSSSPSSITYSLSKKLRAMFGNKVSTWYDIDTYYSLPRRGLSRRLYMLYQSHPKCWPLTQLELREFLGLYAVKDSSIRAELEKAHSELVAIRFLSKWELRKPKRDERLSDKFCYCVTQAKRGAEVVEAAEHNVPVPGTGGAGPIPVPGTGSVMVKPVPSVGGVTPEPVPGTDGQGHKILLK